MQKENKINHKEYIIAFCYSLLVFFLISEPFVLQIVNNERMRMYGYILFLIGAIILGIILKQKGGEK